MRAIVLSGYGEPADVLKLVEVDAPSPGAGEVLIRVSATPVLFGNLLGARGRYRLPGDVSTEPPYGGRQGYEGVGVIEAIGADVSADRNLSVGQRVAFFPGFGAWAEKVPVAAEFVTAVPGDIPDQIAAQLHINPMTAALLFRASLEAGISDGGDRAVLMDAGSASVAKLVAAICERHAIPVVSVVRRRAAIEALSKQLPRTTFIASDEDGWEDRLRAAAPAGGFLVGLGAVGGPVGSTVLDNVAPGGTFITYGDLSGEPLQANALSFAMRGTRVRGLVVLQWPGLPEADRREDIARSFEFARSRPELFPVAAEFALADVRDAVGAIERPGRAGLVLLRP